MSDLGDVLELMHTAHVRPLSIKCRVRLWSDHVLFQESMKRWQAAFRRGSVTTLRATSGERVRFSEEVYHVWHRRPGPFWRVEQEMQRGGHVTIINGQRWWSNGFEGQYWTNIRPDGSLADNVGGDVPRPMLRTILYPRSLPAMTTLAIAGFVTHLGREAVAVTGFLEVDERSGGHIFDLGAPYADGVNLVVDRDSGVLLRFGLILDGQEFFRCEVEEADFDAPLEESLFLGPPDAHLPTFPSVPPRGSPGT